MKKKYSLVLLLLLLSVVYLDGKKLSKSRSSKTSSRRTSSNSQPVPTSHTYSQPSAPKQSFSGWQERPAQRSQSSGSRQNVPSSHSYPSSNTGLSGNAPKQPIGFQEVHKTNAYPQNNARNTQTQASSGQQSHSYPASNGNSGSRSGYPAAQPGGLSGNAPVQKSNAANQQSHAYPSNQQSHAYPNSNGMSGNTGGGYPSHQGAPPPYSGAHGANNYRPPQGPPPPYPGHMAPSYGGYGGYNPGYGSQAPGYFGNYGGGYGRGFGGMSRGSSALTGVGIAGAGVGTLLTGLALWNLARSTGNRHHTVIYDNRGQPVAVAPPENASAVDPILGDLVNCSLTISSINATEVLAIPCAIATSFTPDADVKDNSGVNEKDNTSCTVTVVTKAGREFMTTIPCSILLNSAAENNVTEPPIPINATNEFEFNNDTMGSYPLPVNGTNGFELKNDNTTGALPLPINGYPLPMNGTNENTGPLPLPINGTNEFRLMNESGNQYFQLPASKESLPTLESNSTDSLKSNCSSSEPGAERDPINPCFAITSDITVQPLEIKETDQQSDTTPTPLPPQ